jgi:hypothetical protein
MKHRVDVAAGETPWLISSAREGAELGLAD